MKHLDNDFSRGMARAVFMIVVGLALAGCANNGASPSQGRGVAGAPADGWREGTVVVADFRGGEVAFNKAGEAWKPVSKGLVLSEGAGLRTGPEATCDIRLGANGRSLRAMPGSEVYFERLRWVRSGERTNATTVLRLVAGRVVGDSGKLPPGDKFLVRLPSGQELDLAE